MQSCKLNESESRSNITLKKMGQELDEAETKCFTLKSELNYVMGVCQKVKTDMKDTLRLSSKSAQLSPRRIVDNYDDVIEESESSKQQKQNGLLNVTITPKTQLDKKLPITMPVQNEILKASGEYEDPLSRFPEYVREHLQSMLSVEDSVEELTSKADEESYFCVIPPNSARRDIRDAELNLNIPDTAKVRRAEKSKRASRMERSESNSVYNKAGNTLSKVRKRKGRLRSSVSKSTVATKDTSLIGRKEAKRRKHRGHGVIHKQSNPLKKSNDVVEIFHNTTLKSSNSGISSKHSKFGKQTKCVKRHPTETANQKIQETLHLERVNHEYQFDNKENEQRNQCPQSLNYQCDSGAIPERVQEHDISEKHSKDFCPSPRYKTHQCEHNAIDRCHDPMFTPSYEMPTLASRLKRSNRSYFSRFNFRNIPFVVGTSVTPSHNLGLNIQQVLSVMKTRQPITNDVTPLLIRKVSRGMKPMSILLDQMNSGHSGRSALSISSHLPGIFNNESSNNIKRDKKLSVFDLQRAENARTSNVSGTTMIPEKDNDVARQFNKEKIDSYDHKIKQQSSTVVNKSNTPAIVRNQQGVSKILSNKETNIGDYKTRTITSAHNSKEIRDILINLHDQFEEMNTKYEKLQSEVEKSNDKSLAKELFAMEKELGVKEEEINAVIGLYKEVMTLKQQMKMLHEKNSLVCITTESAKGSHKNPFPVSSILPGKSHSMNPTQIFGRRKFNATREPPASMQLAALLRQIQTFHKQMQLVL